MWVMTFHAACARMLRAHADKLGYTRRFTIYDQADARRLIKRNLDELGIDPKRFTPSSIHNQISDAKNKLHDADSYAQMVGSFFEQTVADVYRAYERELHRMNAMDFDDLLVRAVNVLELFQEVRDQYAGTFRHVLVDEYQDTNHAQYRWLQLLAEERRNLMVVGDDAQCLVAGDGSDDGRRVAAPDRRRLRRRRRAIGLRWRVFRRVRVLRVHRSERRDGIAITLRSGRRLREHARAHALRGTPHRHATRPESCTATHPFPGQHPSNAYVPRAGGGVPVSGFRRPVERVGAAEGGGRRRKSGGRSRPAARRRGRPDGPRARRRLRSRSGADGRALPFTPAALGTAREWSCSTSRAATTSSKQSRGSSSIRPVYDLDIENTHNFIANGIVTHNSIYGFRGADIRNILEFEDTFPDAHVVKLEQNYRSTQTILDAANAVIRNNRGQKLKSLWTDLGQGDPIKIRELEDEHAEARFVTGEVQRLLDEGVSRAEVAVFYRTNAQSRVLQDTLVRGGHPLPGDRRARSSTSARRSRTRSRT